MFPISCLEGKLQGKTEDRVRTTKANSSIAVWSAFSLQGSPGKEMHGNTRGNLGGKLYYKGKQPQLPSNKMIEPGDSSETLHQTEAPWQGVTAQSWQGRVPLCCAGAWGCRWSCTSVRRSANSCEMTSAKGLTFSPTHSLAPKRFYQHCREELLSNTFQRRGLPRPAGPSQAKSASWTGGSSKWLADRHLVKQSLEFSLCSLGQRTPLHLVKCVGTFINTSMEKTR